MTTYRSSHFTDIDTEGGRRKREIKLWSNFKTPRTDWAKSSPRVNQTQNKPPDWSGKYDFSHASQNSPLQIYVRDATNVGNRALIGVRRSDDPHVWINRKAQNVNPIDATIEENKVRWPGLWPGCDLIVEISSHQAKQIIKIWDKTIAPKFFDFSLQTPGNATLEIGDETQPYRLRDNNGNVRILSTPLSGHDSATTALAGTQNIRMTCAEIDPINGRRSIRITPNPDDMESAIGDVYLDPTDTITGSTDIDNTCLRYGGGGGFGTAGDKHYTNTTHDDCGEQTDFFSYGYSSSMIYRITTGVLPAGAVTGFRFYLAGYGQGSPIVAIYRVEEANADWAEGSPSDSPVVGACCHNKKIYNTTDWAGQRGCFQSGTDHESSAGATVAWVGNSYHTATLSPTWIEDWRDGVFDNGGLIFKETSMTFESVDSVKYWTFNGLNSLPRPVYAEIDYTPPASGNPRYYFMMKARQ